MRCVSSQELKQSRHPPNLIKYLSAHETISRLLPNALKANAAICCRGMLNTRAHYIKLIIQKMLVKLFGNVVSAQMMICLKRDSSLSSHNMMCKLRIG